MKVKIPIALVALSWLLWVIIIIFLTMPTALADPSNQTTIQAQAGNVTELVIFGEQQSNHWAGVFGNISGQIVLDDAQNWTMYHWEGITYPAGVIYAANETVANWEGVICMNLSNNQPGFNCTGQNEQCLNVTKVESFYGMSPTDADGFDETFNSSSENIMVGTKQLYNCLKTNLFVNDSMQTQNDWNETILTINNTDTVIFAGNIQNHVRGYNNQTWDFQLMLAVDGATSQPSTYYMYVELS